MIIHGSKKLILIFWSQSSCALCDLLNVPYSGKFLREKILANARDRAFRESALMPYLFNKNKTFADNILRSLNAVFSRIRFARYQTVRSICCLLILLLENS